MLSDKKIIIMEIILSKQCESLTGSLGRGFGYHIQKRKNGFFAKRNSNGSIPPDGHLRFILTCAILALSKLHITDIRVSGKELKAAVYEAGKFCRAYDDKRIFNALEVIQIKNKLGLWKTK